jgi:hypothetical protein
MADCKAFLRHLCSELVSVILPHTNQPQPANLEEIGESSAVVLMDRAIRSGTRVTLNCKNRKLRGVVESYTIDEHLGFFVQIALDAGSRWSPQWFQPEHLFPPIHESQAKAITSGAA